MRFPSLASPRDGAALMLGPAFWALYTRPKSISSDISPLSAERFISLCSAVIENTHNANRKLCDGYHRQGNLLRLYVTRVELRSGNLGVNDEH
jgi:hypothetical protein